MIFRQFFEPDTSTYTYLVGCERSRDALLIDPVLGEVETYSVVLRQLSLRLVYSLETHLHADHITGSGLLRERFGSRSVVHRDAGAACADLFVDDRDALRVGDIPFEVRHTPGHTTGCVSYVFADRVFTGDALLIGGCGRTDFQQGDPGLLYDSINAQLFSLPPDTLVYPGHDYKGDTVSTVRQETAKNARLGAGRTRESFIDLMRELRLAYPRHIDRALPANQQCGQGIATIARV